MSTTVPNGAETVEGMVVVTPQRSQPIGTVSNPLATRLLPSSRIAAKASEAGLQSVEGAKGHLLTVRAVAARLGVSTATVYKLVAWGDLPHLRVSNAIRVIPDDLQSFLAKQRQATSDRTGEGQ